MIERGEKTEEYREISPYWFCRFVEYRYMSDGFYPVEEHITMAAAREMIEEGYSAYTSGLAFRNFDAVCFSYGYTRCRILFECKGITVGLGKPEWGAPEHEVFIIKLGKRL